MHVSNLTSARPYLYPRPRASEGLHVCARARIGGAAAHNRPRRTEARPSASAIVRAAWAGSGSYPFHVRHRRGVPRADVRVERRRRGERLRAEAARGPRRRPRARTAQGFGF